MFDGSEHLLPHCIGGGSAGCTPAQWHLGFDGASAGTYTDAEVNDYATGRRFAWRPPLRLRVRARASHPAAQPEADAPEQPYLRGTAGFGFWNAPFLVARRTLRLPESVWFFYASPPGRLELVPGVPGWGWKAQVVHARRWGALAAGLPTLGAVAWARVSGHERMAARWVQRLSGARETLLPTDLTAWHEYQLDWRRDAATFIIDSTPIAHLPQPPSGPLGFVAWLDNQYAVVTPRGVFRSGTLASGPQWLDLADLTITPL
jgi:hypothetical protein